MLQAENFVQQVKLLHGFSLLRWNKKVKNKQAIKWHILQIGQWI